MKRLALSIALLLILIGGQSYSASAFTQSPDIPFLDLGEPSSDDQAQYPPPNFPARYRYLYIKNSTFQHHWALTGFGKSDERCDIYLPTSDAPTDADILGFCGLEVYQQWATQSDCVPTEGGDCPKLSLLYITELEGKLPNSITLPGPVAYVQAGNCPPWGHCSQRPLLTFNGAEPLHTYEISRVYVLFEGQEVVKCTELPCTLVLPTTGEQSIKVTYYAVSSYGDRSWSRDFRMRNILFEDGSYLLQLMGDPWWFQIPVAPAQWEIFPSLESEHSRWLQDVSTPIELYTEKDMNLLAGKLIQRGTVSATNCEYGGLLSNGAASACGSLAAKSEVVEYQNQFNDLILEAAEASGVPPRLLKGLVSQESQFWDGWVIPGEYGYGMMTDQGADLLLTWNLPAYLELCIPVYGITACSPGYSSLSEFHQAYLRGLALHKIGTDQEFVLLAQMLAASAGQAGQLVRNVTSKTVGYTVDYEQMWMISLAVYHGGAGCVGTALTEAWKDGDDLSWATISEYLPEDCQLNADYPNRVLRYSN